MTRAAWFLTVALLGCGGAWDAAKSVTDIAVDARDALDLCAADAGTCNAAQVRALEQNQACLAASLLTKHGLPVPDDAGGGCQP